MKPNATVYSCWWRNKWLTADAQTIDDMIKMLEAAAAALRDMRDAGVTLDPQGDTQDDYARLITPDPAVAERFGFEDESQYLEDEDDDSFSCPVDTFVTWLDSQSSSFRTASDN
jgi:hypothetical protein